ncbi:hypothetical protein P9112_011324 [Eukaryota sp. TZLM1-RC]
MTQFNVLLLGGLGFVGRNIVTYLVESNVCSYIRIVDKTMPVVANLSPRQESAVNHHTVEYMQSNLANPAGVEKAFTLQSGSWDFVINLTADTKYGQSVDVYRQRHLVPSKLAAEAAIKAGVKKFIHFSTAQVYAPKDKASKENDKMKPWTNIAAVHSESEQQLSAMNGLPLVILRPAVIYGVGDTFGIMPRISIAAVYKYIGKTMELLWSGDLRLNTVHVDDVARATWHCCLEAPPGSVFNLVDKNDTNQRKVNEILEQLFGIKTGFKNAMLCRLASTSMKHTTARVNGMHGEVWAKMVAEAKINVTPFNAFLDQELLYNHPLSVNGEAIEKTGFNYEVPYLTVDTVKPQLDFALEMGLFPPYEHYDGSGTVSQDLDS